MNVFVLFIACISVLLRAEGKTSSTGSLKLPEGFPKCKWSDENLNDCILNGASLTIAELVKGIPEQDVPSIDPFYAGSVYIDQAGEKMNIKENFTNLVIHGLASTVITDFKIDKKEHKFEIKLKTEQPLKVHGDYNITGKIMVLPIVGQGQSHFVLKDFTSLIKGDFTSVEKGNELFWRTKNLEVDFNVTKIEMKFDNLFNGDQALGNNMNMFLNENWALLYEDLKPAFKAVVEKNFKDYLQKFLERINLKEMVHG